MNDDDSPPLPSMGKGFGRIARYIKMYGGLGREIQPGNGEELRGTIAESRVQFHDHAEKYPQSCVLYREFNNTGLRLMYEYLREKEYWTMRDVAMGMDERQTLEAVQAALIFMTVNVKEYDTHTEDTEATKG